MTEINNDSQGLWEKKFQKLRDSRLNNASVIPQNSLVQQLSELETEFDRRSDQGQPTIDITKKIAGIRSQLSSLGLTPENVDENRAAGLPDTFAPLPIPDARAGRSERLPRKAANYRGKK